MASAPSVLRRLEPLHIALAGLWGVGMTLAALTNRSEGIGVVLALLVWAAAGLSLVYLTTIAASVRVTPTHVLVNNPYVQHSIPRRLVTDVVAKGYWIPRLVVDGGPPVRLVALDRNLPRGYAIGPSHRQARLIMRMIAETPAQDGPAVGVNRRWRIGNLAVAALTVIGWVSASVYLLSTVKK